MEIPDLLSKDFKRLVKRSARGDVRIHERRDWVERVKPEDLQETCNPGTGSQ